MKKYSAGNAVLIKRDIEAAGIKLKKINQDIELAKQELDATLNEVSSARSEWQKMLDMAVSASAMQAHAEASVEKMQKDADVIKSTIDKLTFYKAVLSAEIENIEPIKFDYTEYDNAILLYNKEIEGLESKANLTEAENAHLEKIRREKQLIVDQLLNREKELIASIEEKEKEHEKIIKQSDDVMRELVREKAALKEMQEKGREMAVMEYRLTDEYRQVYESTPSRTNRP